MPVIYSQKEFKKQNPLFFLIALLYNNAGNKKPVSWTLTGLNKHRHVPWVEKSLYSPLYSKTSLLTIKIKHMCFHGWKNTRNASILVSTTLNSCLHCNNHMCRPQNPLINLQCWQDLCGTVTKLIIGKKLIGLPVQH